MEIEIVFVALARPLLIVSYVETELFARRSCFVLQLNLSV